MRRKAILTIFLVLAIALVVPGCGRGRSDDTPGTGSGHYGATSKLSFFGPTPAQFNYSKDVKSGAITTDVGEGAGQPDVADPGLTFLDLNIP